MLSAATRILLVRHGATLSSAEDRFAGSQDVELSDLGRQQVAALGRRLANEPIAAAYCSDMQRAIDTCHAIADPHGLTPTILPDLRELDHGHWEGLVHKDVEHEFVDEYQNWSADPLTYAPPGGSTGLVVLNRAAGAMRRIVADHPGQTVLAVAHKATNRLLIAYYLGMDLRRYRDRLDQDPACLNILTFASPTEVRLTLLNDTSHVTG